MKFGLDITVRPYPGHVDPEKVTTDLPPYSIAAGAPAKVLRRIQYPAAAGVPGV